MIQPNILRSGFGWLNCYLYLCCRCCFLSACGQEDLSEGDVKACDIYESTVEGAENDEISDGEMLQQLEEAWLTADSDHLQDLLDDMLIYFEEGQGDLTELVNDTNSWCSID